MMRKPRVNNNEKIFVSIASYRDPDVVNTVDSLLDNSDDPDNVKIVIVDQWGNHPDEVRPQPSKNIEVVRIPYEHSRGCCWARHMAQKKYTDEKYYMQIDAHSRAMQGWDTFATDTLNNLKESGVEKPVLSTYPESMKFTSSGEYTHFNSEVNALITTRGFENEKDDAILNCAKSNHYVNHKRPVRMPWVLAGFIFSYGSMINEVPYNKDLYFYGEEDDLSIRLFTNGYDVYSCPRNIIGHDYERNRVRHWGDHSNWYMSDQKSKNTLSEMIRGKNNGTIYGLGTKRPLKEFETLAQIDYNKKIAHTTLEDHGKYLIGKNDE